MLLMPKMGNAHCDEMSGTPKSTERVEGRWRNHGSRNPSSVRKTERSGVGKRIRDTEDASNRIPEQKISLEELIRPSLCSNDLNSENKEQLNKRPFIEIFLSGNNVRGLVDTGAAISAIDEKLFYQLKGPETFKNEKIAYHHEITAANRGRIMVVSQYKVTFDILGRGVPVEIYVVKNFTTKLILGMDFIQRGNVVINGANQTLSVNGEVISRKFLGARD